MPYEESNPADARASRGADTTLTNPLIDTCDCRRSATDLMSTLLEPPRAVAEPLPASAPSAAPERFYHPELDGLRFVAFLLVFLHHALPLEPLTTGDPRAVGISRWLCSFLRAGEAGVDLFFVLSSYLITELLVREHARDGRIGIGAFYVRRTLRIWPLYFAFLAFAALAEAAVLGNGGLQAKFWPFAVFLGNWSVASHGVLPASAALVLWSVSIEEQFYLAWPWLVSWFKPRRIVLLAVSMLVVANGTRIYLALCGVSEFATYFNTFARLDGIAAGALLSAWLAGGAPAFSRRTRRLLFAAGFGILVVSMRYLKIQPVMAHPSLLLYPLWSLGATLMFVATLRRKGPPRGLSHPWLVYLGRISYGLYVFHLLAVLIVFRLPRDVLFRFGFFPAMTLILASTLALTIGLATLSYYVLERPFLKLKLRFTRVASRPGG